MIEVCTGFQISKLMDRVESHLPMYRDLVVCAPYIDCQMATRVRALRASAKKHGCSVRVITSSKSGGTMSARDNELCDRRGDIIIRPRLHAKVYLAIARDARSTEAIVTSANMTRAGIRQNIEFGLRIDGSSYPGRSLLHQIQQFLTKLAARDARGV